MGTLRNVLLILIIGIAFLFAMMYGAGYALRNAAAGDDTLLYLMIAVLLLLVLVLRRFRRR